MDILIAALLFLALAAGLVFLAAAFYAPGSALQSRLRSLLKPEAVEVQEPTKAEKLEQALEPISRIAPPSEEARDSARAMLIKAGLREQSHVNIYFSLRILLPMVLLVIVLIFGYQYSGVWGIAVALGAGYILPSFLLKRMIKARQRAIQLSLPDALDMAVICVEAGLGLNQALQRVGVEVKPAHPELADELEVFQLEMRAGKPRREALQNLASRSDVPDLRTLVMVLLQTEKFGTSIAQALRVQSDSLRTERRQRAEEAAAKTTIKMIPALVLFVFPAMFVVSMGPVVISISRDLLPALGD